MSDDLLEAGRELIRAVESERRRTGEILHDTLCQTLAGSTLLLSRIERDITAERPTSVETLSLLQRLVDTAVTQARSLAQRFRPVNLEGAGLMTALRDLSGEVTSGTAEFICERAVFVPEADVALAIFRIAEHAVEMSRLQAKAPRIELRLQQAGGEITLSIHDLNNAWIKSDAAPGDSLSVEDIEMMKLRAKCAGGELSIQCEAGKGTLVLCKIPARQQRE